MAAGSGSSHARAQQLVAAGRVQVRERRLGRHGEELGAFLREEPGRLVERIERGLRCSATSSVTACPARARARSIAVSSPASTVRRARSQPAGGLRRGGRRSGRSGPGGGSRGRGARRRALVGRRRWLAPAAPMRCTRPGRSAPSAAHRSSSAASASRRAAAKASSAARAWLRSPATAAAPDQAEREVVGRDSPGPGVLGEDRGDHGVDHHEVAHDHGRLTPAHQAIALRLRVAPPVTALPRSRGMVPLKGTDRGRAVTQSAVTSAALLWGMPRCELFRRSGPARPRGHGAGDRRSVLSTARGRVEWRWVGSVGRRARPAACSSCPARPPLPAPAWG